MIILLVMRSFHSMFFFIYDQLKIYLAFLLAILKNVRGAIINVVFEIQKFILIVRDSIQKTFGIFTTIVYFFISLLLMIVGMIAMTYYTGIALIVMVMTVIVAGELAIPFIGEILAAITVAFAVAMGVILKPFGGLVDCLLQTPLNCKHELTVCFHKDTTIQLKNNISKKISNISIRDTLNDGAIINGIIKIKCTDEIFYKIGSTLVTSNHFILHDNSWIYAKDYPEAIKTDITTDYVYCLSTTTNKINIDNYIFHDWNDDYITNHSLDNQAIHISNNLLDPNIIIERFFSESPSRMLIHPKYGLKNFEVKHLVEKRMEERDTFQGRLFHTSK